RHDDDRDPRRDDPGGYPVGGRMRAARVALLVAGAIGHVALALLYPRLSPVAAWQYQLDRPGATAIAEGVATRLAVDVHGWPVSIAVIAADEAALYLRSTSPGPVIASMLTPIYTQV